TCTGAGAVGLPAASRAIAVRRCKPGAPVHVSQEMAQGGAVTAAPRLAPSSWNCTLSIQTSSLAAAETVILPTTWEPPAGAVIATTGGTVSPSARRAVLA